MWSDTLTTAEAEFTQRAIDRLAKIYWAKPVVDRLQQAGGIKSKNMPLMFEVRFAHELYKKGKTAQYEFNAGVGDSTVEFKIASEITWLVELVSIRTSQAARKAITQNGLIFQQVLSTGSEDIAQSEEAEMITAEQKIGEKVFAKGKPTKFPKPEDNVFSLILIDTRGYLDHGGSSFDYRQMAYGAPGIPRQYSQMIHYWKKDDGKLEPISGLFEDNCPLRAAPYIQDRIHFLGFICERDYCEGEMTNKGLYLPNPHLLPNDEAKRIYDSYPLRQESE